jgi:hypothetical protein
MGTTFHITTGQTEASNICVNITIRRAITMKSAVAISMSTSDTSASSEHCAHIIHTTILYHSNGVVLRNY